MNFQKCTNDVQSLIDQIRFNSTPGHPKFSTFSSRLKTFNTFPSNTAQNKYKLVESGFHYINVDDAVQCIIALSFFMDLRSETIYMLNIVDTLRSGNQYVQKVLSKYCNTEVICNCETASYDTIC
ncbi:hypothetical protein QTP88_028832 [Uroleucon formosanum]